MWQVAPVVAMSSAPSAATAASALASAIASAFSIESASLIVARTLRRSLRDGRRNRWRANNGCWGGHLCFPDDFARFDGARSALRGAREELRPLVLHLLDLLLDGGDDAVVFAQLFFEDIADVEEGVGIEADFDEGGLHAGQHE